MSEKDGGPAFPQANEQRYNDPILGVIRPSDIYGDAPAGMSLRDYFAANSGLTMQLHIFTGSDGQMEILDPSSVTAEARQRIADWKAVVSYQIADAMLKERSKP